MKVSFYGKKRQEGDYLNILYNTNYRVECLIKTGSKI